MKLLIHRVPANVANENLISSGELNAGEFDFQDHFAREAIAALGRFLVCYKAKPWMINDLMFIDASDNYAKKPSSLSDQDVSDLGKLIDAAVQTLNADSEIAKIVVGANINPLPGKEDHESVWRLHVHVCGISQQEMDRMEPADEEIPIFNDPIIERFKELASQIDDCEPYAYGIKRELGSLGESNIAEAIREVDAQIETIIEKILDDFSVISYSFAVVIEEGNVILHVSPKSCDGRGVLEAIGIILNRDENLPADKNFIENRNKFLRQVKQKILAIDGAQEGKFNLEAR